MWRKCTSLFIEIKLFFLFLSFFHRFYHLFFHRIDTHIFDGFGKDEFIGHEDNHSGCIHKAGCGEGYFLYNSFVSLDSNSISDFEIVTENERETPGEIGSHFFTDECEKYSPDSRSCQECPKIYADASEYENERYNSYEDSDDPFGEWEYLLGKGVVLEESSKGSSEDEIGDERWDICPAENHDDRESFTNKWKIGNYIAVKIHRRNEGERECQVSAGKSDKENGHEKNLDTHKMDSYKMKIMRSIFAKNDFFATRIWFFWKKYILSLFYTFWIGSSVGRATPS